MVTPPADRLSRRKTTITRAVKEFNDELVFTGLTADMSKALPRTTRRALMRIRSSLRPYAPIKQFLETFVGNLFATAGSGRIIEGIMLSLVDELESTDEAGLIIDTLEDVFDRLHHFRVPFVADRMVALLLSRLALGQVCLDATSRCFVALGRVLPQLFEMRPTPTALPSFVKVKEFGGMPVLLQEPIPEMVPILHELAERMEQEPWEAGTVFLGLVQGDLKRRIEMAPVAVRRAIQDELMPAIAELPSFKDALALVVAPDGSAQQSSRTSMVIAARNLSPLLEASAKLIQSDVITREMVTKATTSQGTTASVVSILPLFNAPEAGKRSEACDVLGAICRDPKADTAAKGRAQGLLFQALQDPVDAVVGSAASALAATNDEMILDSLVTLLEVTPPDNRGRIKYLTSALDEVASRSPWRLKAFRTRLRTVTVMARRARQPDALIADLERLVKKL